VRSGYANSMVLPRIRSHVPAVSSGRTPPRFLPWSTDPERTGTALLSLTNLRWQMVLPAWSEVAYPVPGYLVLGDRGGGIRIAPINSEHPVGARVDRSIINQPIAFLVQNARSWFAVSPNATLVYASADFTKSTLAWVDQNGVVEPVANEEHDYWNPALSPDGKRVAVRIGGDVWVYDLGRSAGNRLTFSDTIRSPSGLRTAHLLSTLQIGVVEMLISTPRRPAGHPPQLGC